MQTILILAQIYLIVGAILGSLVAVNLMYDKIKGQPGMELVPAVMFVVMVVIGWPLIIVYAIGDDGG